MGFESLNKSVVLLSMQAILRWRGLEEDAFRHAVVCTREVERPGKERSRSSTAQAFECIANIRQLFNAGDVVVLKHVFAETLDVQPAKLYWLGRSAVRKILGDHVCELEARTGVAVERVAAVVDASPSDRLLNSTCLPTGQRIFGGSDKEDDLHTRPYVPAEPFRYHAHERLCDKHSSGRLPRARDASRSSSRPVVRGSASSSRPARPLVRPHRTNRLDGSISAT